MMKSADPWEFYHFGGFARFLLNGPLIRRIFTEAQVSSIIVVIFQVGFYNPLKVAFIEDNHTIGMIETIYSNGAYHSFNEWILPRAAISGNNLFDAHALYTLFEIPRTINEGDDFRYIGKDVFKDPLERMRFDLTGSELLRLKERGVKFEVVPPKEIKSALGRE